ncbi:MAG TPA: FAD:protein FMN transferase, partial [Verrucomicrobiae bacterium]|nr:FAD:protein FMN transferase [Verrucomicrobiae bacterium]
GHVLDARTGRPCERAELAAVNVLSAADSDALSTALLVEGPDGLKNFAKNHPNARALIFAGGKISCHNINEQAASPR